MSSRRCGNAGLLLLVLAAVGLAAPDAAFAFRRTVWNLSHGLRPHEPPTAEHPIDHWDLREFEDCRIPLTISRLTPDLDPAAQSNQILIALRAWEDVAPAQIRFVLNDPSPPPPLAYGRDGYNTIAWNDSAIYDGQFMGVKIIIPAITYIWTDTLTGRILEADIRLSGEFDWKIASHDLELLPGSRDCDVRTVVLHELGHFIGLAHPEDDLGNWDENFNPPDGFPGPEDVDRNGNGDFDAPLMYVFLHNNLTRWKLSEDDRDGCNFLYNPDMGDAPDPWETTFNQFPSRVHNYTAPVGLLNRRPRYAPAGGAEHLFSIRPRQRDRNYSYEWLGWPFYDADDFSGECESNLVDRDPFDDGVKLTPNPPIYRKPVKIVDWMRYANDAAGHGHDYQLFGALNVNTWLDYSMDGIWQEYERLIHQNKRPVPESGPNAASYTNVETSVVLPDALASSLRPMWLRTRLDWGEDGGDRVNRDGTLDRAKGAAQFGEVEDYPLRLMKPTRQMITPNASGHAAAGVGLAMPGPAVPGQNYSQYVTGGDCATGGLGNPGGAGYDPLADETTLLFTDPGGILEGRFVHVGRAQTDAPAQALRAYWIPMVGPPGIEDRIPTTNAVAFDLHGPLGERTTRILVGTVNDSAGGFIAGDPLTSTWTDSMFVTVTARISPTPFMLPDLNLCNPSLIGLAAILLGGRWITPETPFEAVLPSPMTSGALILEVQSSWSVNEATNTELLQFDDVVTEVTAVPQLPIAGFSGFQLRAVPTPTVGGTSISFSLPHPGRVSLSVYDLAGSLRRELLRDQWLSGGEARQAWDGLSANGQRLPAGVYFLRLDVDGVRETSRIVLLR